MKKTILTLVTGFISLTSINLNAQTPKEYPDPDAAYKIYNYIQSSNEFDELQTAEFDSEERRTGYISSEYFYYCPGEKSPVRIKKQDKNMFIVKLNGPNDDPMKRFKLYKLQINSKKKRREYIMSKENGMGTQTVKCAPVFYTQKKVRDLASGDVVRILSVEKLEPGEYVWCTNGNIGGTSLFFGIDE